MGLPMAVNLQRAGFEVTGWNRSAGRGAALVEAGGRVAESPAAAVQQAAFIFTMLGGPESVAAVSAQFLPAAEAGALWTDSSTIGQSAAQELAGRALAHGLAFVDAPVSGSVPQATEGQLVFLTGGEEAALDRVRPLLGAMGREVIRFGAAGQGAAAKMVNNMLAGTMVAALAEALTLSDQLGLDRAHTAEFLMNGAPGAPIVKTKAPLMRDERFAPAFQLKWMEKDVALAVKAAQDRGIPLTVTAGAQAAFAAARVAGYGDADMSAVFAYLRAVRAGAPLS